MSLTHLSPSELQDLLMNETKRLTSAIRDQVPVSEREELRKRIQEIQKLLEAKRNGTFSDVNKKTG